MAKINISLSEVHGSVGVPKGVGIWKRMFAFIGPAYLISVGYMDPGNWATDLEAGARFGYALIWVLLLSNAAAILLQTLAARLGIVAGRDLAQACRDHYPRFITRTLWVLTEIAIAATDLAEVLGTAIGINLLFGIPVMAGVIITAFDTVIFLGIQNLGMRKFETFIMSLITIIGLCFIFELFLSKPDIVGIAGGFAPRLPEGALYVAIGIIGATVMPHNLYLHSALVQSRAFDPSHGGKKQACRFNLVDSAVALNAAFFVNAAILILAAAVFYGSGIVVTELQQAHEMVSPLLGTSLAGAAFALALICAGQASTITGTLAGQIVMEGYLHFKIRPFLRRLLTRLLAIIPAVVVLSTTGDKGTYQLLIFSQVVLSLQLIFAVVPLIHFTSDPKVMGEFANRLWVKILAWLTAAVLFALNAWLVVQKIADWLATSSEPVLIWAVVVPVALGLAGLLMYIVFKPFIRRETTEPVHAWRKLKHMLIEGSGEIDLSPPKYRRIGVAVSHSEDDQKVLSHAYSIARHHDATVCLFHVVEGAAGSILGSEAYDTEAREDETFMNHLARSLANQGLEVEVHLGFGNVPKEIARLSQEQSIDILVMAGHGHRALGDMLFGSTINPVRHELKIPIMIVR